MANDPEFFSGLQPLTDEVKSQLHATGRPFAASSKKLAYPDEFPPQSIIEVESQDFNDCVGNGLSSCGEACFYIDKGGKEKIRFSRFGAYIWSQSHSGPRPGKLWLGQDQGAGLEGAVYTAANIGFCPEAVWPYPSRYSTKVPAGAVEAAAPYKAMLHTPIRSYDQGFEWMNQGKGPLLICVDWTTGLRDGKGDITLSDLRTRVIGGHCMFLWGWTKDGRLWDGNSHSKQWGQQGWRPTRPEAVDQWAREGGVYAFSDLADVKDSRKVVPADFGEGW